MDELPSEHMEHAEHAEHAVHEGNQFFITVSATIAVLAVVAAVIASFETTETGAAISDKNSAVLRQAQASDEWAYYQARSIKQKMFELAADEHPDKADDYRKQAKHYEEDNIEEKRKADELQKQRDEFLEAGERHEGRHHGLTLAETMVHVGIAVATVSIITKGQRWPWYGSILLGIAGIIWAAWTYLAHP
ncbi:DUF4337 domain-containing protein [Methylovirgula sp. 4M-Z18]|uniref:DUF4337 domain-containing protein n=1 Tax=Methylovirgula sp. 4M-Z18 TaxID=2293567 RepID=UPI000E2E4D42|nr:DUF4337 domain-containing protein [Methylovirgula sp. 4M-Z18]RFB80311.1 DUF4337 family protein [Methylovirgula sp. 4M-Z18]